MRWAYPNGGGQVCWYCDRVFKTEESHKWDSRKAYEHALVTNMEVLNNHYTRREAFLQRRRDGAQVHGPPGRPSSGGSSSASAMASTGTNTRTTRTTTTSRTKAPPPPPRPRPQR